MSYLATLAGPAQTPGRVTTPHAPLPAAAILGEVHEEIDAAPLHAAPAGAPSLAGLSPQAAPDAPCEARAVVEQPIAVEAPALPPLSSATGDKRGIDAAPVVEPPRVTPARAQRPEPAIDMTSLREAASLPRPLVSAVPPSPRTDVRLSPSLAPTRPAPTSQETMGTQRQEREQDASEYRRAAVAGRAVTALPVAWVERDDRSAVRSGPPARPGRDKVSVHIGAISLTVKAPGVAATPTVPVVAPLPQALPAAAPSRSREGLGFSASRHYLRWS